MAETYVEYGQRLQGYVAGKDPIKILRETPGMLRRLILRKPPKLLSRRPQPEKWSVGEILSHLADDELVLGYRMRRVLEEPDRSIDGFDQARWADVLRYASDEPSKSLERFRQMREWNLDLFARLSAEEWSLSGVHSERGRESLRDMALLYAGHDLNHAGQIRAIVAPGAAGARRTA
jgi:DinB superfamily